MKKLVFQSKWVHKPTKGEVNNEPTMTVPEMTLSIRDIFEKYVTFPEIAVDGEDDGDDVDLDDIVLSSPIQDLTDYQELTEQLDDMKSKIREKAKKASQTPNPTIPDAE